MKDLATLTRDMAKAREDMKKLSDSLPRIAGVESVKIVKQNFQIEAYDSGNGINKWAKRKNSTNAAYTNGRGKGGHSKYKGSVFSATKPLLRQTLALYNSIHYVANQGGVFVGVSLNLVPYAKIHNEGGTINIKARRQTFRFNEKGRFTTKGKDSKYWRRRTISDHTITMPKRQYMPLPNQSGNRKIQTVMRKRINYEVSRIMKSFRS